MAPFDRSHTSSYSSSIVTMAISLASFARYSDLVENRQIVISRLYLASPQGWPCRNFVKMFDADKNRMTGLPYGEKKLWRYVKRFSHGTGRTDRQTDLLYQYRSSVCWRAIKAILRFRMNISLAILSEIFIQIYYFFLRVMQGIKSGCFFLNTV